jgi:hypothetical protein
MGFKPKMGKGKDGKAMDLDDEDEDEDEEEDEEAMPSSRPDPKLAKWAGKRLSK